MDLRIPGSVTNAGLATPAPHALLCIHASGAWSYAGGDDNDDPWPVVAAFEV